MKRILFVALACLLHYNAYSQVDIYIDSVFVSRVVDTLGFEEDGFIIVEEEHYEEGPFVRLFVSIFINPMSVQILDYTKIFKKYNIIIYEN